ncbi:hypothetical protein S245_009315 [Arachis hypogaea]
MALKFSVSALFFGGSTSTINKHFLMLKLGVCYLSTDFPHAHFLRVEVEEQPEISEAYSVSAVPFFVFFKVICTFFSLE